MGVFGAVVGRRGAVGFTLARISGCRGVIGFIVGTWLCPVREKVRPACSERPAIGYLWRAGRFFRDNAARGAALGEFCRAAGLMLLMLGERCRAVGVAGMPCDYTWAWPGVPPTDHSQAEADWALLPQTNRPPTHHAGAGGNASIRKQRKQRKRHYSRKRCKRRTLTSSRASRGTRWSRAAGSRRAGRGGSQPRARGAR